MSVRDCEEPGCEEVDLRAVMQVITPHEKDLGGFTVRRVLPALTRPRVGPFIFFDHMGPSQFDHGHGIDVRPHPHIGLSTLTYLFEGEIMHRDSLGVVQPIQPHAVNWMTAGRGIVHSERTPDALRASGSTLHGLQIWIALPDGHEEIDPGFVHHPAGSLPAFKRDDSELTVIAGEAWGQRSPVSTYSPLFYVHVEADAGAILDVPKMLDVPNCERAVYLVEGEIRVAGASFGSHRMVTLAPDADIQLEVTRRSTLVMLGGEPLASDRIVWWNFCARTEARLEQARRDWAEGRFDPVPGETEFIPLPAR